MSAKRLGLPDLGIGVGLRIPHYPHVFEHGAGIDWFEIISENFMVPGGRPLYNLDRALDRFKLVQHGVSLSLGSAAPLDFDYLRRLKVLIARTKTPWVSDHLCFTGADGHNLHDLLPLPYTDDVIAYVAERARIVQDFLETPFLIENVSSYLTYAASRMPEWEFVAQIVDRADVGMLLDVNNIYVASENQKFDPHAYIDAIDPSRVVQIHLAGHSRFEHYILDTHSGHVIDEVWGLYEHTIERCGSVSTLIEWDDEIPDFPTLESEADKARRARDRALTKREAQRAKEIDSVVAAPELATSERGR